MRCKQSAIVPRSACVRQAPETNDLDVDVPSAEGFWSPSPISSSPDKAPPTGRDGLPCARAGGGSGFDLDDEDEVQWDETTHQLSAAVEILGHQVANLDARFVRNALQCMQGTIKWVCARDERPIPDMDTVSKDDMIDFLRRAQELFETQRGETSAQALHQAARRLKGVTDWARAVKLAVSRRGMPLTNARRAGEPNPVHLYGYRYRERENAI
ncbi:hypothetical protein C8Q77DRAFT_739952 [Trametes polyzona]|nr:hypothetical protein C8Q77DRAFT_739952 [Trametes polyzona]